MKITVIQGRCQGHAVCAAEAPDVFTFDDEGFNVTEPTEVELAQADLVRRAVDSCPERALRLEP
jgi:ferredoxin